MRKTTNKRIKENKLPLNGVICCVETFNSDGVDSSQINSKILQVCLLFFLFLLI